MQVGRMVEMNVLQTGVNVAVTQLKSNNCDEGQFLIFFSFLLCCSVQETGQSFKASSFLTLTQLEGERRKKKSVFLPHLHWKFIILFSVDKLKDSRSERLLSPVFSSLPACRGLSHYSLTRTQIHMRTHTVWHSPETLMPCPPWDHCSSCIQSTCFFMHVLFLFIHPVIYLSAHFVFLSIWSTVLALGTCTLQQDVGFVLTRLISCRRRHRLIKIIPCYRGCFGQPNDTGGRLCSTHCSRLANCAPQPQLAPN